MLIDIITEFYFMWPQHLYGLLENIGLQLSCAKFWPLRRQEIEEKKKSLQYTV